MSFKNSKLGTIALWFVAISLIGDPCFVLAVDEKTVQTTKEVTVQAVKPEETVVFLPDVQGTKINAGKKTSNIDLKELPANTNNNFRQAFVKTPGLLVSEETTPLFSVGYRGLDPHRGQFTQVMKDGVPIHADMFGYPEAYYVTPSFIICVN